MSNHETSVLIVDDNEVDRYLLKRCLSRVDSPLNIIEVQSGEQALAFFKESPSLEGDLRADVCSEPYPPVIVFLDINMPVMNGLEFLDELALLRDELTEIDCTVIMCSTARRADEEKRALSHDFVKGYFSKGEVDDSVLSSIIAQFGLSQTTTMTTTDSRELTAWSE